MRKKADPRKSGKRRRSYTKENMKEALDLIQKGNSVHGAAKLTGIPVSTLQDWKHRPADEYCDRTGKPPLFSKSIEQNLVRHVSDMAQCGYPYTMNDLRLVATGLAEHLGKRKKRDPILSVKWVRNFQTRWPEIRVGQPQGLVKAKLASKELAVMRHDKERNEALSCNTLPEHPDRKTDLNESGISHDSKLSRQNPIKKRKVITQKPERRYRTYTKEAMRKALDLINEGMAVRKAALLTGVPCSTLSDRKCGIVDENCEPGKAPLLPKSIEQNLVQHIADMARCGRGYTPKDLRLVATGLAEHLGKRKKRDNILSKRWIANFQKRWPETRVGNPEGLVSVLAASKERVGRYDKKRNEALCRNKNEDQPGIVSKLDKSCSRKKPSKAGRKTNTRKSVKSMCYTGQPSEEVNDSMEESVTSASSTKNLVDENPENSEAQLTSDPASKTTVMTYYEVIKFYEEHDTLNQDSMAVTTKRVVKYYKELNDILTRNNLKDKPERIYILDESGISLEENPADRETMPTITSPRDATTTLIALCNAIGNALPPYFVFKGRKWNADLMVGASPGAQGTFTLNGWSSGDVFLKYLSEHALRYMPSTQNDPCIILYNDFKTKIRSPALEWAGENNIILYSLPPHAGLLHRPLDVSGFGPFKDRYRETCQEFLQENPGRVISCYDVSHLVCKAYYLAFTHMTVLEAFKRTGIFPFNNQTMLDEQFEINIPNNLYTQPGDGLSADQLIDDNDEVSSEAEDETDPANFCCVCKLYTPHHTALELINWAQCGDCGHWTHLKLCSPVKSVGDEDNFLCPHCN